MIAVYAGHTGSTRPTSTIVEISRSTHVTVTSQFALARRSAFRFHSRPALSERCSLIGESKGEMSEWLKEHAWKLNPLTRADAHQIPPTHFRSTSSRNNDRLQHVPVNDGVDPGFRGVCDTVLTQNRLSLRSASTEAPWLRQTRTRERSRSPTIMRDPSTGEPVDPVTPLVRANGAEVGVRTVAAPDLQTIETLWTLSLASELVFSGDAGTTEASRPSRRFGMELANYDTAPWTRS
jgi:hypothetical protein